MADRTKRIFISDIHMGVDKSIAPRKPYVWFRNNAPLLARFLDEQIDAQQVQEVVILGDLFDQWIIPADYDPLTSFESICEDIVNKPVIEKMKVLAAENRLVYVPGNHDMALDIAGILTTQQLMVDTFPGIRFVCDDTVPLGRYEASALVAEHGNRYCLFNAPDTWTNPGSSFLPLGFFISRMVAYKVSTIGHDQDPRNIFIDLLRECWKGDPDFIENLFQSIADDCGLTPASTIDLDDIPGYGGTMMVGEIGQRFASLFSNWGKVPGAEHVVAPIAVMSELGDLYNAAASTYFRRGSDFKVAVFGHTHNPAMKKEDWESGERGDETEDQGENPSRAIYANSGTWVDHAREGGTYVETEEADRNLYVRVREYPGNTTIGDYEGFVEI